MKYFILAALAILSFSGCNAILPASDLVKLDGNDWKLTAINHKVISDKGIANIKFEDGEASGKAFCNTFSTDYELMGDTQLTFDPIKSTKMYCEGIMDLENQMVTNLQNVKHYKIKNGKLYLLSSTQEVLLAFKK